MKRILSSLLAAFPLLLLGQNTEDWISSPGIIGTIVLLILVLALAVIIFAARASSFLKTPSDLHAALCGLRGTKTASISKLFKHKAAIGLSGQTLVIP